MSDRFAAPLRFPGCAIACLLSLSLLFSAAPSQPAAAQEPSPQVVKLVIDYGDGVQKHFTSLRWKENMTVLDVLTAARRHPRGIEFSHQGKGATALLTRIDDLENEGSGRNWLYQVNGELADRSFAVYSIKASDTVLWEFRKYR